MKLKSFLSDYKSWLSTTRKALGSPDSKTIKTKPSKMFSWLTNHTQNRTILNEYV
jgi:hypothetical protein